MHPIDVYAPLVAVALAVLLLGYFAVCLARAWLVRRRRRPEWMRALDTLRDWDEPK